MEQLWRKVRANSTGSRRGRGAVGLTIAVLLLVMVPSPASALKRNAVFKHPAVGGVACPFAGGLKFGGDTASLHAVLSNCTATAYASSAVKEGRLSGSFEGIPLRCASLSAADPPFLGKVTWLGSTFEPSDLTPAISGEPGTLVNTASVSSFLGGVTFAFNVPSTFAKQCSRRGGVRSIHVTGTITMGPNCGPGSGSVSIYSLVGGSPCGGGVVPRTIASGPDGALWFTSSAHGIGRMTTSGVVTSFPDVAADSITAGSDGAMWYTIDGPSFISNSGCSGTFGIGRVTTSGVMTTYTDPRIVEPGDITAGPDGNLWFENGCNINGGALSLGEITTSGVVTVYPLSGIGGILDMTFGPDGALWFTSLGHLVGTGVNAHWADPGIGRLSTSGALTSYIITSVYPNDITAGPDGDLWFTAGNSIGRLTTSGAVTMFTGPDINGPFAIAPGPDGALWFTNYSYPSDAWFANYGGSVGRITTSGNVTLYTSPGIYVPFDITAGPDGAMWFVNSANDSIGRVAVP